MKTNTYIQSVMTLIHRMVADTVIRIEQEQSDLGLRSQEDTNENITRLKSVLDNQIKDPQYWPHLFMLSMDMSQMTDDDVEASARNLFAKWHEEENEEDGNE
jgi:hypothetical protein